MSENNVTNSTHDDSSDILKCHVNELHRKALDQIDKLAGSGINVNEGCARKIVNSLLNKLFNHQIETDRIRKSINDDSNTIGV